jgi:formate hydrogenlyase subunit 3/multisubunit Na+/H+ antiporter MnhD subunit
VSAWLLLVLWVWPLLLALPASRVRFRQNWGEAQAPEGSSLVAGPRRPALPWVALGPLPALVAALTLPLGTELPMPWFFLGTQLGLDATARVYLGFTALVWLAAGVYAAYGERGGPAHAPDARAGRFDALFLLAMAGNLWLIVGQDLFSFYAGFAMMGIASYGLVIHDGSTSALRAGKVYLVMALLGEVALFAGLVLLAHDAGTTLPASGDLTGLGGLTIALLLLGLGVKAGMVPLHLWLPLAHPAAPIPASAVLSGTMIKVALLGWLRFLPVGELALPQWGHGLALAGLATMTLALPVGLVQRDPKVILAYSSIAKMGFLILMLGLTLVQPALAPVSVAGIALYAAQHGLAKGGLFLGVGMRKHAGAPQSIAQAFIIGLLLFLALALAGAPFTSGAMAKYDLKPVLDAAEWTWLGTAIAVSAVGTTLLMARFVWVAVRTEPHAEPGWLWPLTAWGMLAALVALFPFAFGKPASWLSNAGPVGLGVGIAAAVALVAALRPKLAAPFIGLVPPGDLLALIAPLLRAFRESGEALLADLARTWSRVQTLAAAAFQRVFGTPAGDVERGLRQWPLAGALWVGICALLLVLLFAARPLALPDGGTAAATDARPARMEPQPTPRPPNTPAHAEQPRPADPGQDAA